MDSPQKGVRFAEVTKFALALNSPSSVRPSTPGSASGRRRQHQELARRLRVSAYAGSGSLARDNAQELSAIRSVEDLEIDFSETMGVKRGDLAIIQGETYQCFPRAPHLSDIPLVLHRLDCMDRRIYDLKIYEADTFMRFQGHANIISLYSYWSEPPPNQYTYKTLVLLEEKAAGHSLQGPVQSEVPSSHRRVLKWCCDIAKALVAFHNCNIIHGRVKPSSIFLDAHNNAQLGMMGKVELDSARQTHQLFSKVLIGEAIPHTLVYWAPELLRLEKYSKAADMWAFGVVLYQLCTGELPFSTASEHEFRDDALAAAFDPSKLNEYPRVQTIVDNLLQVAPEDRWTAHQVLAFAQQEFALNVQAQWRSYMERSRFLKLRRIAVLIQSLIRGFLTRLHYVRRLADLKNRSAVQIQSAYRGHIAREAFTDVKSMVMKCQARVLARQCRESYKAYRQNVVVCQAAARRYITQRWFDRVREGRSVLESKLRTLQAMVLKYREEADEYSQMFADEMLPRSLQYIGSFEDYELSLPAELVMDRSALPRLRAAEARIAGFDRELEGLQSRLHELEQEKQAQLDSEEALKAELGCKYHEYEPMLEALKRNLKRVSEMFERAEYLPLAIQHPYEYSKWDSVHEPDNLVDNTLDLSDRVYRSVGMTIDLTLHNQDVCFVAAVEIVPGEPGPAVLEVYISSTPEEWKLLSTHKCTGQPLQSFELPGEPLGRFLRLSMRNNIRGGNIVSIKTVRVKGLVRET